MRWPVVSGVAAAALVVGAVLSWTTIKQGREFERLIVAGDAAIAQEQIFVAIEAFSGALALRDDSMLASLKRGDAYRRRGEFAAALRDLRRAAQLEPTAPRPAELLGDVNAAMGRYARALEDYQRFIRLDDRSPRVLYKLALTYYRNGQAARAIEPLRQSIAMDGALAESHYLLGLCLRDAGRMLDALTSLERAVTVNPALAEARDALAELYAALTRDSDSIEQLEALAALEPGRAEPIVRVGLAYAKQGRIDSAILTLGRAADRYPDDPAIYTALGRVWLASTTGRPDRVALAKAREALEGAAARPTATSETLTLYGRALYLSGNIEAAERALLQATARPPVDVDAFRYLAEVATRLRHTPIARDAESRYEALTAN